MGDEHSTWWRGIVILDWNTLLMRSTAWELGCKQRLETERTSGMSTPKCIHDWPRVYCGSTIFLMFWTPHWLLLFLCTQRCVTMWVCFNAPLAIGPRPNTGFQLFLSMLIWKHVYPSMPSNPSFQPRPENIIVYWKNPKQGFKKQRTLEIYTREFAWNTTAWQAKQTVWIKYTDKLLISGTPATLILTWFETRWKLAYTWYPSYKHIRQELYSYMYAFLKMGVLVAVAIFLDCM